MIEEDYVSFEIAKLLKEKGFNVYGDGSYGTETEIHREYSPFGKIKDCSTSRPSQKGYPAPTLQMAMKWLREVHHIYIQINLYLVPKGYSADIIHIDSMDTLAYVRKEDDSQYDTYEQAAEAAIKYYLENLI